MTTSQRLDAIEMSQVRRRPFVDTPQAAAYRQMIETVAQFQNALVQANPTEYQIAEMVATVTAMRQMLTEQTVPEDQRLYGRGEIGGSNQLLVPRLTFESVDDHQLQAHTVAGHFFNGINDAMHGGVVSVVFDTVMGRLAMGTEHRVCRTAYLNTQFRNVTPIGERLDIRASVDVVEGRKRFISGQLWHGDTLCAEAESLFIEVKPGQQ